MSLSAAQPGLEAQIFAALKKAQLSKDPQSATQTLAKDLALAIHTYALQATVNPGQAVLIPPGIALTAPPYVGATIAPGTGTTTSPGTLS